VRRTLERLDLAHAELVIEYGPGNGVFTREILARLPKDAQLLAIELNQGFVKHLNREIQDKRLLVVNGSADQVDRIVNEYRLPLADCVISGIPFSFYDKLAKNKLIATTSAVTKPSGSFSVYQTSPKFSPSNRSVASVMEQYYETVIAREEPFNLPPLSIIQALENKLPQIEFSQNEARL